MTTDAKSGATLNGSAWLSDLLKTGVAGYVAVQTVKNANRTTDSVTTGALPRVDSVGTPVVESGPSTKTLMIVGGIVLTFILAAFMLSRRK